MRKEVITNLRNGIAALITLDVSQFVISRARGLQLHQRLNDWTGENYIPELWPYQLAAEGKCGPYAIDGLLQEGAVHVIKQGPNFGIEAAQLYNQFGYAVIPAWMDGTQPKPSAEWGGKYLQNKIAPLASKQFKNSRAGFVVIDNPDQHMAWIDIDCHEFDPAFVRRAVMNAFGIDANLFNQSLFQHNQEQTSVHLMFRMPDLIRRRIVRDHDSGNDLFVTNMKNIDDSRIPLDIEFKFARQFEQIRLKPTKTVYVKPRDEFPMMTDKMQGIMMDIYRNRKQKFESRTKPIPFKRSAPITDGSSEQKRRHDRGISIMDGIIGDIMSSGSGGRWNTIRKKAFKAGKFLESWGFTQSDVEAQILTAVESVSDSKDRANHRKTALSAIEAGMKKAEVQPLDDNQQKR